MPAIRNASTANTVSASATGLTGLNNAGTDFSWGAWLRMRAVLMASGQVQSSIWVHADNGGGQSKNGTSVFVTNLGELRLRPQTASNGLVSSPNGVVTPQWHHFGIRKDATGVTFFRDGHAVARVANTTSMTVAGTRLTELGGPTIGGVQSLRGTDVWDLQVYPLLALTDAEMRMMADPRSIVRGCKQRLCYLHNWRVAGTGAQTLLDESGNGNSLTTSATTDHASVVETPDWRGVLFGRRVFGYVPSGGTLHTQAVGASLTPAATLQALTARALAASMAPSATIANRTSRALAASSTVTGTVARRTARSVAASVTAAATVGTIKAALLSLSASLTPAAGVALRTARTLGASVTAAGTLSRRTARALAASVTVAGALTRRVARALAASLTATASVLGSLIGAAVFSGFITATLTWIARYSASLTARARHDATLTAHPSTDADLTGVPRHDATLTHLTDD